MRSTLDICAGCLVVYFQSRAAASASNDRSSSRQICVASMACLLMASSSCSGWKAFQKPVSTTGGFTRLSMNVTSKKNHWVVVCADRGLRWTKHFQRMQRLCACPRFQDLHCSDGQASARIACGSQAPGSPQGLLWPHVLSHKTVTKEGGTCNSCWWANSWQSYVVVCSRAVVFYL